MLACLLFLKWQQIIYNQLGMGHSQPSYVIQVTINKSFKGKQVELAVAEKGLKQDADVQHSALLHP